MVTLVKSQDNLYNIKWTNRKHRNSNQQSTHLATYFLMKKDCILFNNFDQFFFFTNWNSYFLANR